MRLSGGAHDATFAAPAPAAASTDRISCVTVLRLTFSQARQPPP